MNKLDEAFQALKQLPPDEQERAADLMLAFAAQQYDFQLSDEHVAEVERRMREENPKTFTIAEVREHFRNRYK